MDSNTVEVKLKNSRDAAAYLCISERKLWSLAQEGNIPAVKIGRSKRFAIDDLDAFIERCKSGYVAAGGAL